MVLIWLLLIYRWEKLQEVLGASGTGLYPLWEERSMGGARGSRVKRLPGEVCPKASGLHSSKWGLLSLFSGERRVDVTRMIKSLPAFFPVFIFYFYLLNFLLYIGV